jgi:hypothetical protein
VITGQVGLTHLKVKADMVTSSGQMRVASASQSTILACFHKFLVCFGKFLNTS